MICQWQSVEPRAEIFDINGCQSNRFIRESNDPWGEMHTPTVLDNFRYWSLLW